MNGLKRILAATDGSEHGLQAVVTAAALARRAGAELSVMSVAEAMILPEAQTPPGIDLALYEEAFLQEARRQASEQARQAGVPEARLSIRPGIPHTEIAAEAEEWDADLIVLGAHTRPALARFLVGSTAERVIRTARRPVLVAVAARREPFERILVPVDLSDHSRRVLAVAAAIARSEKARLRVLFVQEPLPTMMAEAEAFDPEEYRRHGRTQLERTLSDAGLPGDIEMESVLREGRAGDRILDEAKDWNADLIVMGTHGFGFFERLILGSTSLHVLRHGQRASVVVPSPSGE